MVLAPPPKAHVPLGEESDDRSWWKTTPRAKARMRVAAVRARRSAAPLRITVVGAGMAGLVAALELEHLGHEVTVLEASPRIGGRVFTWRTSGDHVARGELGAMRIPGEHVYTLQYIEEVGLTRALTRFASTLGSGDGWFVHRGVAVPWPRVEHDVFALYELEKRSTASLQPTTLRFAGRLKTMIDTVAPLELRRHFDRALDGPLLEALNAVDLSTYLTPTTPQVDVAAFVERHPMLCHRLGAPVELFLRDVAWESQRGLYTLDGGMDQLPLALARRLKTTPLLGHVVTGFDVGPNHVGLSVQVGTTVTQHTSDFVVCTVPFTVLRRLSMNGISASKRAVIATAGYCPATKVLALCRERFWEPAQGASRFDTPLRQMYYPSGTMPSKAGILTVAYAIGADAQALDALDEPALRRLVHHEAAVLHPELADPSMVLEVRRQAWAKAPFFEGGCSVPWGLDGAESDTVEACAERAATPEGRLLFAGEHCSYEPAWIEGAVTSALNAVELLAGATR